MLEIRRYITKLHDSSNLDYKRVEPVLKIERAKTLSAEE